LQAKEAPETERFLERLFRARAASVLKTIIEINGVTRIASAGIQLERKNAMQSSNTWNGDRPVAVAA